MDIPSAVEVLNSMDNNLLIDEAKHKYGESFEKKKISVVEDIRDAIDPEYCINYNIREAEDNVSAIYDEEDVPNSEEKNKLVKWGFSLVLERPRILMWEIKEVLKSDIYYFHPKTEKEFDDREYLLEALFDVIYGAAIADYIHFLKNLKKGKELAAPDTMDIVLENIKPKILVVRELGIIKLLNEKFNSNNTKVAECLGVLLNEKPSSIRGILSNINGRVNNKANPENIAALENAITVLNKLGCTDEVINLQNKLAKLNS